MIVAFSDLKRNADRHLIPGAPQEVVQIADSPKRETVGRVQRRPRGKDDAIERRVLAQHRFSGELERLVEEHDGVSPLELQVGAEPKERKEHVLAALVAIVETRAVVTELNDVAGHRKEPKLGSEEPLDVRRLFESRLVLRGDMALARGRQLVERVVAVALTWARADASRGVRKGC